MKIQTTRFGTIEAGEECVIHFRDGMVGFSNLKNYVLIESASMPLILWLQSLEDIKVAFPVIEPWFFKRDYNPHLTEADKACMKLETADKTKMFVVLTIPQEMANMTANLKAPIVINANKGLGTQLVLQEKTYEVRVPAHDAFNQALSNLPINQSASDVAEEEEVEVWTAVEYRGFTGAKGANV